MTTLVQKDRRQMDLTAEQAQKLAAVAKEHGLRLVLLFGSTVAG